MSSSENTVSSSFGKKAFVVFHIHPVSARLRFLCRDNRHVVLPNPLPKLAEMIEIDHPLEDDSKATNIKAHPAAGLGTFCHLVDLDPSLLQILPGYSCQLDIPGGPLSIIPVQSVGEEPLKPPDRFDWIELPDCFRLREIERVILNSIYQRLLGTEE